MSWILAPHATEKAGFHHFWDEAAKDEYGSFEVFWDDDDKGRNFDSEGRPVKPGWYWWACFPGCLPDGDTHGPFNTSTEAYNDARGNVRART